ncbi:MAG: hypothetical protein ABUL48_01840 [Pseudorhodoplanes sp.]
MRNIRISRRSAWLNRREKQRALLAFACLTAVIAFSAFVRNTPKSQGAADAAASAAVRPDDEIYTGSILFVPREGNDCRQNLLDNLSGRIWDNGVVPCDTALAKFTEKQGGRWSAARVDAIRDGFRKK